MWWFAWLACREDGPRSRPVEVVDGPRLDEVDTAPLARELTIETAVPTRLRLHLRGDGVDTTVAFPDLGTRHVVPVLGAKPGRDVDVEVTVEAEDGARAVETASFSTPPLPADFPAITVRSLDPDAVRTGVFLAPLQTPFGRHWLVAIDPRDGEVTWWYAGAADFGDVDLTPRGTLLGLSDGGFLEIDALGRTVTRMRPASIPGGPDDVILDGSGFSHELVETDDAWWTLASRSQPVDAYPRSYDDPTALGGPTTIVVQDVVAFARDGSVSARFDLAAQLDTTRIGYDSLDVLGAGWDWCHANAILPDDHGFVVSLRHQDALVAVDRAGAIRWILSNPYGWSEDVGGLLLDGPEKDGWPLHQHGPAFDADGNLMFFDNGNEGHTPYTEPPGRPLASRVTAIAVDEAARTAETAWVWQPPGEALYSPALGNVAPVGDGHVLADYGFVSAEDGVDNVSAGRPMRSVRVFELIPGVPDPVFDVSIDTEFGADPDGVKLYRALPTPSLYPPGVEVVSRWTP